MLARNFRFVRLWFVVVLAVLPVCDTKCWVPIDRLYATARRYQLITLFSASHQLFGHILFSHLAIFGS
jgi:hypothetical protein